MSLATGRSVAKDSCPELSPWQSTSDVVSMSRWKCVTDHRRGGNGPSQADTVQSSLTQPIPNRANASLSRPQFCFVLRQCDVPRRLDVDDQFRGAITWRLERLRCDAWLRESRHQCNLMDWKTKVRVDEHAVVDMAYCEESRQLPMKQCQFWQPLSD